MLRDATPIFNRCERVVCNKNSLHFFQVRVAVKGGIAAKEEVCDDTYGPDVATG